MIKLLLLQALIFISVAEANLKETKAYQDPPPNSLVDELAVWQALAPSPLKVRLAGQAVWKITFSVSKSEIIGTAFFIGPKLLLANFHIIEQLENSDIKTASLSQEGHSRRLFLKRIIALSALHDLALIETEETVTDYLELKNRLLDTKELYVPGYPDGEWTEIKKTGPVVFESDSFSFAANHSSSSGSSGSPVLNEKGHLVGIITISVANLLTATALDPLTQLISGNIGLNCAKKRAGDCIKQEIKNLKQLAEKGHVLAQDQIGLRYNIGLGIKKNPLKARTWLELAAKQAYVPAQHGLAIMYLKGESVEKNPALARKILRFAAKQGYAPAQYKLAVMYLEGEDGKKYPALARKILELAAKQGYAPAQHRLAIMYLEGEGGKKDPALARKILRFAAKQGYAPAKEMLDFLYGKPKRFQRQCHALFSKLINKLNRIIVN